MTLLPQLERELTQAHQRTGRRRRRVGWIAPALAVGGTLAIAAIFVIALRHGGSSSRPAGTGELVLRSAPLNPHAPANADLTATVGLLRQRYAAELPGVHVDRVGDHIVLRGITASNRARALALAQPGRLAFFDWEANALLPDGATVARRLSTQAQDRAAITMSQGTTGAAGTQGSGGYSLYAAVKLASRQPGRTYPSMSHLRSQLYLFGRGHSRICGTSGHAVPTASGPCYVAGPAPTLDSLVRSLPLGTAAAGQILTVPPGTVILQAADASAGHHLAPDNPAARFFVLRDNEALASSQITRPAVHTDQAGSPAVTFDFTRAGTTAFQRTTAAIAHRAAAVSSSGLTLNQHFAIAVDGQLLSAPQIDFKSYPDGITTSSADVTGALTTASAHDLAAILRFGPLSVRLTPG